MCKQATICALLLKRGFMKHNHKNTSKFKLTDKSKDRILRVKLFNDKMKKNTKSERKNKKDEAWNKMMMDALKK